MSGINAFIVAARRTANGRVGGLHRNRRLEDLSAPVVNEALSDSGLTASRVDLLTVGNTTAGGNPARTISLVAGLGDGLPALTIDRQEASGLEAIVAAVRTISAGDAEVAVAGGAEALSMAPWRIAKPRSLYQTPRFIGHADMDEQAIGQSTASDAANTLAQRLGITRRQLDELALTAHLRAGLARDNRRMLKEIVALRAKVEETRDELTADPEIEELSALPPLAGDGTATAGNVSQAADGAAFVVAVSERVYGEMGRPPALQLRAAVSNGAPPGELIGAPVAAVRRLLVKAAVDNVDQIARIEFAEASAAHAIAFRDALGIADGRLNADGGQLARGLPLGASSAVLVVRLFSALIRAPASRSKATGLAVATAAGGQAIAVVLDRVGA
ncbi:MAG: thiolase family protein [Hyphomicrobiaceae bacterium]|nr:thiolase family protein [Hyphomicrobiaceae bacterium]